MPEKTAISLEHDGENKVHGMLDPEWVEQLFASLAGTLWRAASMASCSSRLPKKTALKNHECACLQ